MSQAARLAAFDARARIAFAAAGLADTATYTPAVGTPVACTALVDMDVARYGLQSTASNSTALVSLFHAEVPSPAKDAVVAIDGGACWKLVRVFSRDESRSRWEAVHAAV